MLDLSTVTDPGSLERLVTQYWALPLLSPENRLLPAAIKAAVEPVILTYCMDCDFFDARSLPDIRRIIVPPATSDIRIATLAHEAGHVATTTPRLNTIEGHRSVEVEFAATKWAIDLIRQKGVFTEAMNDYLRLCLFAYQMSSIGSKYAASRAFLLTGEI